MSDLRKQLDAAKNEYRSARYPGDLASELLKSAEMPQPQGRQRSMRLFIGVIGSLAAAAVVGFVLLRPHSTIPIAPTTPNVVALNPTTSPSENADESMSLADLAAMPAFPDDVSVSTEPTAVSTATTMASKQQADEEYIPMVPSPPSMTDLGSMPSLPSMDFSFSDTTDTTTNQTSKEST